MTPVVFVSGPFRGPDHWAIANNVRKAEALALDVWRAGAACLCPHLNTAHFQGTLPDDVWLEGDLAMLAKCDAVLMTQDWSLSQGARAEEAFARERQIPVFYSLKLLREWLALKDHEYQQAG